MHPMARVAVAPRHDNKCYQAKNGCDARAQNIQDRRAIFSGDRIVVITKHYNLPND